MTWRVRLPLRPQAAALSRWYGLSPRRQPNRLADGGARGSPVVVRGYNGCLVIQVLQDIGPAAEPRLGRMLHAAVRPDCSAVLLDLRHVSDLGVGGTGVLGSARTLAEQHGLAFGFVPGVPATPALPGLGQQLAEVPLGGVTEGHPSPSVAPPAGFPVT